MSGWNFKCTWTRCNYRFCKNLISERKPHPTKEQFKPFLSKFKTVFNGRIGSVAYNVICI